MGRVQPVLISIIKPQKKNLSDAALVSLGRKMMKQARTLLSR